MYAVIQTGGKQYRVRPGDVIVVEKLDHDVGTEVKFEQVLMAGGGEKGVHLGDALKGAGVTATLIETRKGEKVKIFKKIRRQGYRRTKGHRQFESVLRVTAITGGGEEAKWDGTVDLTPRSELVARARGLAPKVDTAEVKAQPAAAPKAEAAPAPAKAKAPKVDAASDETAMMDTPVSEQAAPADEAPAPKKAPAAKDKAPKAEAAAETPEAASEEAAPKKKAAPKKPKAAPEGEAE